MSTLLGMKSGRCTQGSWRRGEPGSGPAPCWTAEPGGHRRRVAPRVERVEAHPHHGLVAVADESVRLAGETPPTDSCDGPLCRGRAGETLKK
jgi:hypothetical protein